jgi:hypothetical protein
VSTSFDHHEEKLPEPRSSKEPRSRPRPGVGRLGPPRRSGPRRASERSAEQEGGPEGGPPPALEAELARVHAIELGRMLREAAAIRYADAPGAGLAPYPLAPLALARWRERAREVVALAHADGVAAPGLELVQKLLRLGRAAWPSTASLCADALACAAGDLGRLCLGYSLLAEGRAREAEVLFDALARKVLPKKQRWRAFEGLALAHRALGRVELALGALERAADDPYCSVDALVGVVPLAVEAGDFARLQRAAARLDLLIDPGSSEFRAALGRLRARGRLLDVATVSHALSSLDVFTLFSELASSGRSPAERVCRALS